MGGGAKGRERQRDRGCGAERRGEGGVWLTGSWDKMTLQGMTVLTIYDPQVSIGDCSNFFFYNLLIVYRFFKGMHTVLLLMLY